MTNRIFYCYWTICNVRIFQNGQQLIQLLVFLSSRFPPVLFIRHIFKFLKFLQNLAYCWLCSLEAQDIYDNSNASYMCVFYIYRRSTLKFNSLKLLLPTDDRVHSILQHYKSPLQKHIFYNKKFIVIIIYIIIINIILMHLLLIN